MQSKKAPRLSGARVALALLVSFATFRGWQLFWFLTDDAHIAFRYVSNSVLGRGYVWNPAPFLPVEGYTSFAWVALLDGVWRVTGAEPPATANVLSLGFGLATLYVAYRIFERARLPQALTGQRLALLTLAFVGTLTNRTFLAWLSSGLETAMFNFFVTWWVYLALTLPEQRRAQWATWLAGAATLIALTRPDGLLFASASALLIAAPLAPAWKQRWREAMRAWPLALIALHLLWRHSFYGFWLPNTYYAKYDSPWPESGLRYAASFIVEYGVWVWLLIAAAFLVAALRRGRRVPGLPAIVTLGTLAAHAAYYTLIIGGDHFEYRVYSHLVPLLFISGAFMAAWLSERRWVPFALVGAFVVASWPIPWVHWAQTHQLETRSETHIMIQPIADEFPQPLRPLVARWDQWQAWLIEHHVCMRHQEHKIFLQSQLRTRPSRMQGSEISWAEHPVLVTGQVGVPGWALPNVAILDLFGLNDPIVARNPRRQERLMAHGREHPHAYYICFRPNVELKRSRIIVQPRAKPLSDDEIRHCQQIHWPEPR